MLYIDFEAGNKAYKLRLTTKSIVELEKKLGCNPLMIFGAGDRIPPLTEMIAILHASLQHFHHGLTVADTYNIFDAFLYGDEETGEGSHTQTDFIPYIVDIYKQAGIMPKGEDSKN